MTRGRLFLTNIRRVAIHAVAGLLELAKLFFDRSDLRIRSFLTVLVARRAGRDRNVGREPAQRARPGNVDVTSRALHHVFALAAFVAEHRGCAFRRIDRDEASRGLMATATVIAGRLQIFPVTVEARVVAVR